MLYTRSIALTILLSSVRRATEYTFTLHCVFLCMLMLGYNQHIAKILRYPEIFRLPVHSLMKLILSI